MLLVQLVEIQAEEQFIVALMDTFTALVVIVVYLGNLARLAVRADMEVLEKLKNLKYLYYGKRQITQNK